MVKKKLKIYEVLVVHLNI